MYFHFLLGVMSLTRREMLLAPGLRHDFSNFRSRRVPCSVLWIMAWFAKCLTLFPGCFSILICCCLKAHFPPWPAGLEQHL